MYDMLFLKPYVRNAIWGGTRLNERFGYTLPSDHAAEAWIVSAVGEAQLSDEDNREGFPFPGESIVTGGPFDGWPLSRVWREHRELFANLDGDCFPLLVKYIDARDDLSIQVHPDDAYARTHENGSLGKSEYWYVLDCARDADIVIGHDAKDRESLARMIREGAWEELLTASPIHPGDFFYIPAGTVHAIHRNTLILEVQQTSNLTYRIYDYDRLQDGKKRALHIAKALDVTACPQRIPLTVRKELLVDENGKRNDAKRGGRALVNARQMFINEAAFYAERWTVEERLNLSMDKPFLIVCVLEGEGTVNGHAVSRGVNFIATSACDTLHFEGRLTFFTATVR